MKEDRTKCLATKTKSGNVHYHYIYYNFVKGTECLIPNSHKNHLHKNKETTCNSEVNENGWWPGICHRKTAVIIAQILAQPKTFEENCADDLREFCQIAQNAARDRSIWRDYIYLFKSVRLQSATYAVTLAEM